MWPYNYHVNAVITLSALYDALQSMKCEHISRSSDTSKILSAHHACLWTILKLSVCYSFPSCYHSVSKTTNSVSHKTWLWKGLYICMMHISWNEFHTIVTQIRCVYAKRKGNNHNSMMQTSVVTVENQSNSWQKQLPRYIRSQSVVSLTVVQPPTENTVLPLLIPKLCVLTFPIKHLVLYFLVPWNFNSYQYENCWQSNPFLLHSYAIHALYRDPFMHSFT
jgi:hypothetical protein